MCVFTYRPVGRDKGYSVTKAYSSMRRCACLLMAAMTAAAQAPQEPAVSGQQSAQGLTIGQSTAAQQPAKSPTNGERRRAAKLYLEASRLYENQHFEPALDKYREAARLDPTNSDYPLAAEVARSHAVTALLQTAAQSRTRGDRASARAALEHV